MVIYREVCPEGVQNKCPGGGTNPGKLLNKIKVRKLDSTHATDKGVTFRKVT